MTSTGRIRCPDCWKGKVIPCAVGCRGWDECCDKKLGGPCERCGGSGWLGQMASVNVGNRTEHERRPCDRRSAVSDQPQSLTESLHQPCACKSKCGDVAESKDHPFAVCKSLPVDPREPLERGGRA